MMGQQTRNESLFYYFRLEEQIPEDHLLRLIDRHVDLSFVRERLKRFYSWTGRPSIDPEVLLRLLLVGYYFDVVDTEAFWVDGAPRNRQDAARMAIMKAIRESRPLILPSTQK